MGAQENKDLVRRFWNDVIIQGDFDVMDQLISPDFVNLDRQGDDVPRLREAIRMTLATVKEQRFEEIELAADGDSVFARVNYTAVLPDGASTTARGIFYYRIVDGKIVENDVAVSPVP